MKKYTIGRNPEADIILTTNLCSRDHAQLTVSANGSIFLQDHSTNGTTVNGKKINQLANLGFCELFWFKCAGDRTCDAWLMGGPLK
jgi:pSer/pThr/pTyr-binding forkhead associated (FHA) protein